jgi:hypothetical protein
MSRILRCHAHGSAWACWDSRKSWPLKAVAMAPEVHLKRSHYEDAAYRRTQFSCVLPCCAQLPPRHSAQHGQPFRFEDYQSARIASAAVRKPEESARLATASAGKDSACRVVRIAKERIVWEPAYPIYIHLSSTIFGRRSLQRVREITVFCEQLSRDPYNQPQHHGYQRRGN